MSAKKAVTVCIVICVTVGTQARGDGITLPDNWTWTYRSFVGVVSSDGTPVTNETTSSDPLLAVGSSSSGSIASNSNGSSTGSSNVSSSILSGPVASPSGAGGSGSQGGPSGQPADAYLNFGTSANPLADSLTTGGAQPWYTSPVVEKWFNNQVPNAQQQADFIKAVQQDVEKTFNLSGLNPTLTTDPGVQANHTISVVSHTGYGANPNAIGITAVGQDGFSFIDKLPYAKSLDQLEWAMAHNISHELMHAFGVAAHHDQTGKYLDAATATWDVLTNQNTTFSQAAVDDIRAHLSDPGASGSSQGGQQILLDGDLEILNQQVPEPATLALWGLAVAGVVLHQRRPQPRREAA